MPAVVSRPMRLSRPMDLHDQPATPHMLGPGDWAVASAPEVLRTLLGSCVCITLWSPAVRIGAMCHFVLPDHFNKPQGLPCQDRKSLPTTLACEAEQARSGCHCDGRYGDEAFALMCKALIDRGVDPQQCEAKVFGGGRMFDTASASMDVGARNVARAFELIAAYGMRLNGFHVGRAGYRRLSFDLSTGQVELRYEPMTKVNAR